MAKEYIDRIEAIKEIRDAYEFEYPTASGAFDEFATMLVPRILKNLPTSDVVEVRCKNCRKWDKTRRFGISCACSHWSPSIKDCRFTLPDDFCSNGVKEEGAENG